jgi:hypothetical protein
MALTSLKVTNLQEPDAVSASRLSEEVWIIKSSRIADGHARWHLGYGFH